MMRLRTMEAYWLIKNGLLYTYPSIQNQEVYAQVVVVGGGITGALISHQLTVAGYKVVMIDKRDIGMGSTSATTALLQYEIDIPFIKLQKIIGSNNAALAYRKGISAIHRLHHLIKEEKISCGFDLKKSLHIAHNEKSADWLSKECVARQQIGIGASWMDKVAIHKNFGINAPGGILSDCAASVDAYRLAHTLIHNSMKRGMQVFDQTEIEQMIFGKDEVRFTCKEGGKLFAEKAVFCSGFETIQMIPEKIADIYTTYVAISEQNINVSDALDDIVVWDTAEPYFYMRTTNDKRLLIGGGDSRGTHGITQQRKEKKGKKLMQKVSELVTDINFVEDFSWAGAFGSTKDGLPYIGTHSKFDNSFFVLGFGGNGITFSVQGMDMVMDWLERKNNKLTDCYRFGR